MFSNKIKQTQIITLIDKEQILSNKNIKKEKLNIFFINTVPNLTRSRSGLKTHN